MARLTVKVLTGCVTVTVAGSESPVTFASSFSGGAKKLRTARIAMMARAIAIRTRGGMEANRPFFFVCDMIYSAPGSNVTRIYYSKVWASNYRGTHCVASKHGGARTCQNWGNTRDAPN